MSGALFVDVDSIPNRGSFEKRSLDRSVLFSAPTHFDVDYEINPYMRPGVDEERAAAQWESLVELFGELADVTVFDADGVRTELDEEAAVTPPEDLPDMAFCSNHALSIPGEDRFVLARMATAERRDEPAYFERWAEAAGYEVVRLHTDAPFEGCGDARWHPGRDLLWGGYGQRSELGAYRELAERFGIDVVPLELTDDAYYHLDVCFSALDETTALVCPDAFTATGRAKLDRLFDTLIEVPAAAAQEGFACNCHAVGGELVVIQETNDATIDRLEAHGYETVGVATDEFMKAGGSVACLAFPY
ncbi:dimethylarginine dimethylaminohydrolase family protein [Halorubrum tibetense]|uniref:Dimethylarginine dimethylaminohydrolase family protein n=1 Tax=Halorubrum tibetense TaxID=175631 RepID=A0ABD5SBG1_9EURY